jgi:hypothetical protein
VRKHISDQGRTDTTALIAGRNRDLCYEDLSTFLATPQVADLMVFGDDYLGSTAVSEAFAEAPFLNVIVPTPYLLDMGLHGTTVDLKQGFEIFVSRLSSAVFWHVDDL